MSQPESIAQISVCIEFWKQGIEALGASDMKVKEAWLQEKVKRGEQLEKVFQDIPYNKKNSTEKLQAAALKKRYTKALTKYVTGKRAYIPQRYIGICPCGPGVNIACSFMSTVGLGPCVGLVLYSKTSGKVALAHVDDEFDATAAGLSEPEKIQRETIAEKKYTSYIKQIMKKMDIHRPNDLAVSLIPSTNSQSKKLNSILQKALTTVRVGNVKDNVNDPPTEPESCVVVLSNGNIFRYEENVNFAAIVGRTLTDALRLPNELQFFYLKNGDLITQDKSAIHEIQNNYVISKPLDQKIVKEEAHLSAAGIAPTSVEKNIEKTILDKPLDRQTGNEETSISLSPPTSGIAKPPPGSPKVTISQPNVATPTYERIIGAQTAFASLLFTPGALLVNPALVTSPSSVAGEVDSKKIQESTPLSNASAAQIASPPSSSARAMPSISASSSVANQSSRKKTLTQTQTASASVYKTPIKARDQFYQTLEENRKKAEKIYTENQSPSQHKPKPLVLFSASPTYSANPKTITSEGAKKLRDIAKTFGVKPSINSQSPTKGPKPQG